MKKTGAGRRNSRSAESVKHMIQNVHHFRDEGALDSKPRETGSLPTVRAGDQCAVPDWAAVRLLSSSNQLATRITGGGLLSLSRSTMTKCCPSGVTS
jgi:hypothetical protein